MQSETVPAVCAMFVVVLALALGLIGFDIDVDVSRLTIGMGIVAVAAGLAVAVAGQAPWARAALTFAGLLGGLAAVVAAEPTGVVASGSQVLFAVLALALGIVAAVLQYGLAQPSSALAALAAGAPAAGLLDQGRFIVLVALAAAAGTLIEAVWPADRSQAALAASNGARNDASPWPGQDDQRPDGRTSGGHLLEERDLSLATADISQSGSAPIAGSMSGPAAPEHHNDEVITTETDAVPDSGEPLADLPAAAGAAFMTIGRTPKLLRESDQPPPLVSRSAPVGHRFDGFAVNDFVIRSASHVGTRHMQQRQIRQDSYAVTASQDGRFVIAAVADGVGSERWASLGADWAASAAVGEGLDALETSGQAPAVDHLINVASSEVRRWAGFFDASAPESEFSTTLVVAVLDSVTFEGQVARVGDANAFTRAEQAWLPHFKDSTAAPDAPTHAIPAATPAVERKAFVLDPGQCLLLVSDGIGDLLLHADDVQHDLHRALAQPVSAPEFSAIAGFQRVQAHDDQTALAIWRRHSAAAGDSRSTAVLDR
jgi:serine/threonine protein phosphatase PrpC